MEISSLVDRSKELTFSTRKYLIDSFKTQNLLPTVVSFCMWGTKSHKSNNTSVSSSSVESEKYALRRKLAGLSTPLSHSRAILTPPYDTVLLTPATYSNLITSFSKIMSPVGPSTPASLSPAFVSRMTYSSLVDDKLRISSTRKYETQIRNSIAPELLERLYALHDVLDDHADVNGKIQVATVQGLFDVPSQQHLQDEASVFPWPSSNATCNPKSIMLDICRASTLVCTDKARFVFNLFDVDGKESVNKVQMMSFITSHYGSSSDTNFQLTGTTTFSDIVDTIFKRYGECIGGQEAVLNYTQFEKLFTECALDVPVHPVQRSTEYIRPDKQHVAQKKMFATLQKWIRKHHAKLSCLAVYSALNVFLFWLKFFQYPYDSVGGHTLRIAKGTTTLVLLNVLFAILPTCREIVQTMRQIPVLWAYIPFDENIAFHKLCGGAVVFFSIVHSLCWLFIIQASRNASEKEWNTSMLSTIPMLRNASAFELTKTIPVFTGIAMLFCMCIAVPFTHSTLLRGNFNLFWFTHMLFIPFLILLCLHGISAWLESPTAYFWIIAPSLIYFLERRYRFGKIFGGRSRITDVVFTSDTVAIFMKKPRRFKKSFKPGMVRYHLLFVFKLFILFDFLNLTFIIS